MATIQHLPDELWLEIVELLPHGDLEPLMRVCKRAYSIIRPTIYQDIKIERHEKSALFARTICGPNSPAAHVRSLTIVEDKDQGCCGMQTQECNATSFLPSLRNLEELHMKSSRLAGTEFMSGSWQSLLLKPGAVLSNLRECTIWDGPKSVGDMGSRGALFSLPSLERLTIHDMHLSDLDGAFLEEIAKRSPSRFPPLERLELLNCTVRWKVLRQILSVRPVRNLVFRISREAPRSTRNQQTRHVWHMAGGEWATALEPTANYLETLTIVNENSFGLGQKPTPLYKLNNLKQLSIDPQDLFGYSSSSYDVQNQGLSPPQTLPGSIEELDFEMHDIHTDNVQLNRRICELAKSRYEVAPNLQSVKLRVKPWKPLLPFLQDIGKAWRDAGLTLEIEESEDY